MKLINLTPHCLNLIIDEVGSQIVIPVAGIPARVSTESERVEQIMLPVCPVDHPVEGSYPEPGLESGGYYPIPVVKITWGEIENLPDPAEGVRYIVSRIVADAAKAQGRTDCLVPDTVVRDDKGIILGCRSLAL